MSSEYTAAQFESEESDAETFAADFTTVVGRKVCILGRSGLSDYDSPDYCASIDGVKTGVELTAIHAGDPWSALGEVERLAKKKGTSYQQRGLFKLPIILVGRLDWPARDVEGDALFDFSDELNVLLEGDWFDNYGFSEIWLMDSGYKYSSRRDPRAPADFFCFAPSPNVGFYERERKRRPYWSLVQDRWI